MLCGDINHTLSYLFIIFICLMLGGMILALTGNLYALWNLPDLRRNSIKKLAKYLFIIGVSEVLISVPITILTIISGKWLLGDTACQFYGLTYNVLHYGWIWILAIAAIDRYVKCHVPTEHSSLFSPTNTRIMALGSLLLLTVLYLAPIYGWGEYSFFRGKVDLQLSFGGSGPAARSMELGMVVHHMLSNAAPRSLHERIRTNLSNYLQSMGSPIWRNLKLSHSGSVLVPLRFNSRDHFNCFMEEVRVGAVKNDTISILHYNSTVLGLGPMEVDVLLDMEQASFYIENSLPYQECGTCGLDYTDVNQNIYSFLGLSLVFNILVPCGIMLFCFGKTLLSGPAHVNPVSPNDMLMARVFAGAAILTLICDIPSLIVNVLFATGYSIRPVFIITTTLICHFRNITLVTTSAAFRRGLKEFIPSICSWERPSPTPKVSHTSRSSLVSLHGVAKSTSNNSIKKYQTFTETSVVTPDATNGCTTSV